MSSISLSTSLLRKFSPSLSSSSLFDTFVITTIEDYATCNELYQDTPKRLESETRSLIQEATHDERLRVIKVCDGVRESLEKVQAVIDAFQHLIQCYAKLPTSNPLFSNNYVVILTEYKAFPEHLHTSIVDAFRAYELQITRMAPSRWRAPIAVFQSGASAVIKALSRKPEERPPTPVRLKAFGEEAAPSGEADPGDIDHPSTSFKEKYGFEAEDPASAAGKGQPPPPAAAEAAVAAESASEGEELSDRNSHTPPNGSPSAASAGDHLDDDGLP